MMQQASVTTFSSFSSIFNQSSAGSISDLDKLNADDDDGDPSKDNAKSPLDLECSIQLQRITKILQSAITKTKLVLAFRHLYKNRNDTLAAFLSKTDHLEVGKIYEYFDGNDAKYDCQIDIENVKKGDEKRFSPRMSMLINILKSYPEVIKLSEEYVNEPPPKSFQFLFTLEVLKEKVIERCSASAKSIIIKEKKKEKLKKNSERCLREALDFQNLLTKENGEFEMKMAAMKAEADELARQLNELQLQSTENVHKIMIIRDRELVAKARMQKMKLDQLQEDFEIYDSNLNEQRESNLNYENAKREKLEESKASLKRWVDKYDVDLNHKQKIIDDIQKQLDEEQAKVDKLEEQMLELDIEYVPAMAAREAEYVDEMTRKMLEFKELHIARTIQYIWRLVLFNRVEKKKLRKLQAAQAAAEKRNRLPNL